MSARTDRDEQTAAPVAQLRDLLWGIWPSGDDVAKRLKAIEPSKRRLRSEQFLWIIRDLADEVDRQDAKHGPFEGSPLGRSRLALACLRDEIDEAERAWRNERKADEWPETYTEVLQVAAVAVRALRDAFVDGVPAQGTSNVV